MNRRLLRTLIAFSVLLITIGASIYFLASHPAVGRQILTTPPPTLLTLLFLYLLFMVSLWLIFRSSLVICRAKLPIGETILVTAYSSIINFFGPLQSGPAFRALYLKKRHKVDLKHYAAASLVYYFFYAYFSGLCLLLGFGWQWVALGAAAGLLSVAGVLRLPITRLQKLRGTSRRGIAYTAGATLLQVSILAIIFYIELHSINHAVGFGQAIVYSGAANFALFVSLTPGAIGFRESFVLLAHKLHEIPNATVVAASLLDRGVYIAMLLLLCVFIFGSHARRSLKRLST
ncbi:flippase-like domain-containing protein [Polaromonas sp.]|nr:flippase-like domain-containing protein [Candidatus Saccharibacteria bacterium]